jgi:hypothetical protein
MLLQQGSASARGARDHSSGGELRSAKCNALQYTPGGERGAD